MDRKTNDVYAGWMSFTGHFTADRLTKGSEVSIYLEEQGPGTGLGKACLQKPLVRPQPGGIYSLLGFYFWTQYDEPGNYFTAIDLKNGPSARSIANMDGVMRDLLILGLKTSMRRHFKTCFS